MAKHNKTETGAWIVNLITDFVDCSPDNNLGDGSGQRSWGTPLIGFASGDDALFQQFKEHVGPFHWTPLEAFSLAYPGQAVSSEELTVISWILPQTEAAKRDNRRESFYPAERWARSRFYGEQFNETVRRHVVTVLQEAGYEAVAPTLLPEWSWTKSEKYGDCSKWSERHAAHACGLGTFGLSEGLITPVGKAMRIGTAVVRMKVPPTERPYRSHQEYCLYFTKGTCGKCIKRCPVDSVTAEGHDKVSCRNHLKSMARHVKETYGFDGYGCGLCQTAVPCESGIPAGLDRSTVAAE